MGDKVLEINNDNFETEIVESGSVAMIDFYATWCGPCKTIAPIVEELAGEYADRGVKVAKVDIDNAQELATRYGIQGVPTLMFFKGGEKVDQIVGAQPRPVIEKKIQDLL
ncbi:MAG: thioredoxin [Planctomycetota bacterium]